jgi:hypothetical protein
VSHALPASASMPAINATTRAPMTQSHIATGTRGSSRFCTYPRPLLPFSTHTQSHTRTSHPSTNLGADTIPLFIGTLSLLTSSPAPPHLVATLRILPGLLGHLQASHTLYHSAVQHPSLPPSCSPAVFSLTQKLLASCYCIALFKELSVRHCGSPT